MKRAATPFIAPAECHAHLLSGGQGIERFELRMLGAPFSPHRHATYTLAFPIRGVLRYRYLGREWHCGPGEAAVLHPDEAHDGQAGPSTESVYLGLHVDPHLVFDASGGRALPFVPESVFDLARPPAETIGPLLDFNTTLDELLRTELIAAIVDLLQCFSEGEKEIPRRLARAALARVHDMISDCSASACSSAELEAIAGIDRWTLARQFRAAYGTTPSRLRCLRRLERARTELVGGASLAAAAQMAGFADQSHMTRQFKRAYGLSPGRWLAALC